MNFCKDCKHVWPTRDYNADHTMNLDFAKCAAIKTEEYPVRGECKESYAYCTIARGKGGECGPDALLFVAKVKA